MVAHLAQEPDKPLVIEQIAFNQVLPQIGAPKALNHAAILRHDIPKMLTIRAFHGA